MTRRELRDSIFKLTYMSMFHDACELNDQISYYLDDIENISEEDRTYIENKSKAILDKLPEIDSIISEKATDWKISRMAKVDLSIIRLAVYEIIFDESIPKGVAINEAVLLAKDYGEENSSAFVNGVLAKIG